MKKLATIIGIVMLALVPITGTLVALDSPAAYADTAGEIQKGVTSVGGTDNASMNITTVVKNVTNLLLFLIGALAVIMIIVSGFYYITSGGNAETVKKAKNTLMYSVIGLIVAILAFAIVNFVVTNVK